MSLFWAVVFALSILIRRPLVGYIWGWVNAHDRDWRACAGRWWRSTSRRSSGCWCSARGSSFSNHLYDADQTGWLGVARIAMGWPLTAVAALVTYLAIRAAQRALHAARDGAAGTDREDTHAEHGGVAATRCPLTTDTDRPLIAVAVLASFVAFLDGSVVNLALPAIGGSSVAAWRCSSGSSTAICSRSAR